MPRNVFYIESAAEPSRLVEVLRRLAASGQSVRVARADLEAIVETLDFQDLMVDVLLQERDELIEELQAETATAIGSADEPEEG